MLDQNSLKYNQISIYITKSQNYLKNLIQNIWYDFKKEEKYYIKTNSKTKAINFGVGLIANTIWMVIALYMVYISKLSLGNFLAFMALSSIYNWPFFELPFIKLDMYSVENSYKKIFEYEVNVYEEDNKKQFNDIELINLEYSYKNKNIRFPNIKINSNEWIAITGSSGSGKSTLIKILLGLYTANKGKILLNGEDNKNLANSINFGYLPQNVSIFLNENLTYNINLLDEEDLSLKQKEFLKSDILQDFISETNISKDKNKFSGGEMKYLGILRAISRKVDVLVLDEFSAGMDANKLQKIIDILKNLNTTIVFVTHDKRVIDECDVKWQIL